MTSPSRKEQIASKQRELERRQARARVLLYAGLAIVAFAIAVTILVVANYLSGNYYHR